MSSFSAEIVTPPFHCDQYLTSRSTAGRGRIMKPSGPLNAIQAIDRKYVRDDGISLSTGGWSGRRTMTKLKKECRYDELGPRFGCLNWRTPGALLRWQLRVYLNSFFPVMPPGTLAANLIGGYIIGLTIAFLAEAPNIAPEWRLLIITGFCGGLTTFSTFSAEVVTRLQDGHWPGQWAQS